MGQTVTKKEFTWVGTDEPHFSRRKAILAKYPEIKELYGPDIKLFPVVLTLVTIQLFFAANQSVFTTWQWWLAVYVVGGTINHSLSLACHELAHNLCFHDTVWNELLAMVANFAQGLPSCITFKKYHLEHHYYQGVDQIDVDIPSDIEGKFFDNTPKKVVWALLQPFFYALRPLVVKPKPANTMEIVNWIVVVLFNITFGSMFGGKAILYNIVSTLIGMGIHPAAGHFIAEHYEFVKLQETYSYYGPLNLLSFNVGYHNEHHDFPKVAGINLPKVRAIASEFYEDLSFHESWIKVIWDYITLPNVGPFSRIKRDTHEHRANANAAALKLSQNEANLDKPKSE
jgi:sphingolipid delta-4 desaturase